MIFWCHQELNSQPFDTCLLSWPVLPSWDFADLPWIPLLLTRTLLAFKKYLQALALALYEDALGDDIDTGEINIDQLRNALEKHDGLLENLTMRSVLSSFLFFFSSCNLSFNLSSQSEGLVYLTVTNRHHKRTTVLKVSVASVVS